MATDPRINQLSDMVESMSKRFDSLCELSMRNDFDPDDDEDEEDDPEEELEENEDKDWDKDTEINLDPTDPAAVATREAPGLDPALDPDFDNSNPWYT